MTAPSHALGTMEKFSAVELERLPRGANAQMPREQTGELARRIEQLEAKLAKKDAIIAEIPQGDVQRDGPGVGGDSPKRGPLVLGAIYDGSGGAKLRLMGSQVSNL